jgi:hypothetical protein
LFDAVVFPVKAPRPSAVLKEPVEEIKASVPNAVFEPPDTLVANACLPIAVLPVPVVFENKAYAPTDVFSAPDVFEAEATLPKAELKAPVLVAAIAPLPTTVALAIAPPPLPTVRPDIEASLVVVMVVKDGEPPDTDNVPLEAGRVRVTVAASVACIVA